jgi:hypothetical protein
MQWAAVERMPNGDRVSDYLIHPPNGGKRNAAEAARLKAQGVKAGVSDLFLAWPAHGLHGLWVELKAPAEHGKPAGKPTQAQLDWLDRMAAVGYSAQLCYGWRGAAETISAYLRGE